MFVAVLQDSFVHPRATIPAPVPAFLWRVEGIELSVAISKATLAELRSRLTSAEPQAECGGVLLGRMEKHDSTFRTRVDAVEPFAIEHRYGSNYSFSPADLRLLEQHLKRRRRDGLVAVGMWRSHTRRGFYLDQRDFGLFKQLFGHPAAVFLLVCRGADGEKGALFVWEGDDVRRHASYLEFPLEGVTPGVTLPAVAPEPLLRFPKVELPGPSFWLRAAMVLLTIGLPVAGFYLGRSVALSRTRGGAVAHAQPARMLQATPVPAPVSPVSAPLETKPDPLWQPPIRATAPRPRQPRRFRTGGQSCCLPPLRRMWYPR